VILDGRTVGLLAGMPGGGCPETETADPRPLEALAIEADLDLVVARPGVEVLEVEDFRAVASVEFRVEDSEGAPDVSSKSEMKTRQGIRGGRS